MEAVLELDTSGHEIKVKDLRTPQPEACLGFLSFRIIGKNEVAGHYYAPSFYAKHDQGVAQAETYESGVMQMTAEMVPKWSSLVLGK